MKADSSQLIKQQTSENCRKNWICVNSKFVFQTHKTDTASLFMILFTIVHIGCTVVYNTSDCQ